VDEMRMMTAREVAVLYRLPIATVYALARRREIPVVAISRLYRFPRAALERWAENGGSNRGPDCKPAGAA
jgi:excisionase family DNA binding protein